ncbi:MAG: family 16 glycoside hydrolase [Thermoguttaceae bacterium]
MKNFQRPITLVTAGMLLAVAAATLPAHAVPPTPADAAQSAEAGRLIAVLRSNAATFEKARACQQLAVLGSKEAVPTLADLLADEKLAAYARCGLESIADPAAGDALRAALGRLHGNLLVGVVNSIGVRRDAKAIGRLAEIAADLSSGAAAEALVALGRIATPEAMGTLQRAIKADSAATRAAAANASLVCAERQLALGHRERAVAIYDAVRAADVPKPARLAATRGAILLRGRPFLAEQLKSGDGATFAVAIGASRLLPDHDVTQLLLSTLGVVPPARQVLVIGALEGRRDPAVLPTLKKAAASAPAEVRLAAIRALGEIADPSSVPVLLEAFAAPETALAETAQASLAKLAGSGIDAAIAAELDRANPRIRLALLDVVARRRIVAATAAALKAADDPQPEVRLAAIRALGRIIGQQEFPILVARLLTAKNADEIKLLNEALQAACPRITDRDACIERLARMLSGASVADHCTMIEWIGRVGGAKALAIVSADARSTNTEIQDAAMRVLGNWSSADAAPVLLDLAKTLASDKLTSRALRGYIRLARQMDLRPDRRLAMCEEALRTARRDDEKKLALAVLVRVPSTETLALTASYLGQTGLKEQAANTAVAIAEKIVKSKPGAVAAAMRQVLQVGLTGQQASRAKSLLERATPKGRVLFDGRTFDGWEGDTAKTFRIEGGAIVGGTLKERVPHNMFLCTTKSYTNFVLRAECKLVGNSNGGIQFRSQRVPNHYEVSGFQADMDTGPDGGYWGTLYDESRRNRALVAPEKALLRTIVKPGWNQYEIRCEGPRIRLFLNGVQTVDYTERDAKIPQSGIIGLQIHGGDPSEAWYRNIVIEELP